MPGRTARALLLGLAACTGRPVEGDTDATSTGTGASSTSTSTTTGEPDPTSTTTGAAGPCLELSYDVDDPATPVWMLTCGLPELCPGEDPLIFQVSGDDILAPQTVEVDDIERARCMAAALRDRIPGQIRWWSEAAGHDYSLEILGETALVRSIESITMLIDGFDAYEALRRLHPPEFFAACADGDAMQVWLCLMGSVEPECLPGPLACPG